MFRKSFLSRDWI